MTAVVENDALRGRRANIRRRELLLTLERWAPAYRNVAGDSLDYVFEIADATAEEQAWVRRLIAEKGMPQAAGRTAEEMRAEGRRANAAANVAFLDGDFDRARDLIDEARAHGALFEAEWVRLHEFIAARAGEKAAAGGVGAGAGKVDAGSAGVDPRAGGVGAGAGGVDPGAVGVDPGATGADPGAGGAATGKKAEAAVAGQAA